MSPRTIFLSRLIGLYCILLVLPLVIHRQATLDLVTAIFRDPSMMFVLGVITVAAGLAIVLAHNIWPGGLRVAIVSLAGWGMLVKGMAFLLLPSGVEAEFLLRWLRNPQGFYVCMAPSLLIGIYMTYSGFAAKSHS